MINSTFVGNKKLTIRTLWFFFCGASARCLAVVPTYRGFASTLRHTTLGRIPLDEWSARQRPLPDNTQHSQNKTLYDPSGILTRNPSKRVAVKPSLRQRGHWDRHGSLWQIYNVYQTTKQDVHVTPRSKLYSAPKNGKQIPENIISYRSIQRHCACKKHEHK
jgi:hypothetical protein